MKKNYCENCNQEEWIAERAFEVFRLLEKKSIYEDFYIPKLKDFIRSLVEEIEEKKK